MHNTPATSRVVTRQTAVAATSIPQKTRRNEQSATIRPGRPEPLRSVTLRLRASTAEALRRVSIQRSLDYIEPFTQQAIVETALTAWLQRHAAASEAMSAENGPQGS